MIKLKNFSFFSTLPTRELEKLSKQCRFQQYTSGTTILIEKEEIKELILVVEGQLSVLKNYGGEKKTLFNLDPGDVYGEVEILNGTKALSTVIGYQEVQLMFIPKEVYLETPDISFWNIVGIITTAKITKRNSEFKKNLSLY